MDQAKKHECAIHAWCLMTNHVHLLVTPENLDSAGLMMLGSPKFSAEVEAALGKRGQIYFLSD